MTATDYSILDDLADDPGVINARKMAIIYGAILDAARLAGGFYSAASVRLHLPRWALGPQVGAVMSVLTKRGLLVRVPGAVHESENMGQRNGTRLMPLYTRTREITPEDLP